jgi:hypothetical protein
VRAQVSVSDSRGIGEHECFTGLIAYRKIERIEKESEYVQKVRQRL